jgi:hypothetical protein
MSASRAAIVALTLASVYCGCAGTSSFIPPGAACEIAAARAPFYKYGPAQAFGADDSLLQGTRVTMVERDFGFSRVMLANGVTGYVATEDLKPIPPEPTPKPSERVVTNRKMPRLFNAPVKRSDLQSTPGDPLFDINDVPLPMSDPPPKSPPGGTPKPN